MSLINGILLKVLYNGTRTTMLYTREVTPNLDFAQAWLSAWLAV